MFMATDYLIFAKELSYELSKSKKRGKIITKLWKSIIKSPKLLEIEKKIVWEVALGG